jgi:hypothetical protein
MTWLADTQKAVQIASVIPSKLELAR